MSGEVAAEAHAQFERFRAEFELGHGNFTPLLGVADCGVGWSTEQKQELLVRTVCEATCQFVDIRRHDGALRLMLALHERGIVPDGDPAWAARVPDSGASLLVVALRCGMMANRDSLPALDALEHAASRSKRIARVARFLVARGVDPSSPAKPDSSYFYAGCAPLDGVLGWPRGHPDRDAVLRALMNAGGDSGRCMRPTECAAASAELKDALARRCNVIAMALDRNLQSTLPLHIWQRIVRMAQWQGVM